MLEECLLNRVPVNAADRAGNTPLHCAAHAGQLEAVQRLLVVPQIKLNVKNRLGDTPLHQVGKIQNYKEFLLSRFSHLGLLERSCGNCEAFEVGWSGL